VNDSDEDGICDEFEVPGCDNPAACNFDANVTDNDGSCAFAEAFMDCEGNCLNDSDGDGVCDEVEAQGCTDTVACNYDATSTTDTDNTLCIYADGICDICSGEIDGTGTVIDNDADDDGVCDADEITGCTDDEACNYDATPTTDSDNDMCVYPDFPCEICSGESDGTGVSVFVDSDGDGVCDAEEIEGCTDPEALNFNPQATDDNGSCIEIVLGCMNPIACNYNEEANVGNGTCEFSSCAGCMIVTACNYDPEATIAQNGTCTFPIAPYLDCDGICLNDADGDGVCDSQEQFGCTDPEAENYDPFATEDDGTCILTTEGCTLPFACNYDPNAITYIPGSCDFSCLFGGMMMDECLDEYACNFGDSGSCEYFDDNGELCVIIGCTDSEACNFQEDAQILDGSCVYGTCSGCTDSRACNFDAYAISDDGSCDFATCVGCFDEEACNYDSAATISDDLTCIYPEWPNASCNELHVDESTRDEHFSWTFSNGSIEAGLVIMSDIYPNPAASEVQFVLLAEEVGPSVEVGLFTLTGTEVMPIYQGELVAGWPTPVSFDASGLESGMYQVRLTSKNFVTSKKLLVVH
jgi:hypothetical protein